MDDAVGTAEYNGGFEFRDAVQQADEYAYDSNGNLTKDLNRNISEVQYNFLNLPSKVTFTDGSTIEYVYAADGTKLRTVHNIGSTTTTTDYCGNVVYENGTQKYLLTEEGYVTLADNRYHYYLQDHQGNNRVVVDGNGTVEEVNHYYPFGGMFASTSSVQPYKYNGKEFDTKNGLNWYDYGAREYDSALGRFVSLDPLAKDNSPISTYAYCNNNPLKYVDPTGMQANDTILNGGILPEVNVIRTQVAPAVSGLWGNLLYFLIGRSMELPVYGIDIHGNPTGSIIGSAQFRISKNGFVQGLAPQGGIAPLPGINKVIISKGLWSQTKALNGVKNALNHWVKHAKDFPQFKNAKQYVEGAKNFLHNPPSGTLTKIRGNGDVLRYNPSSNTFGVMDANGIPKTMFKPKDGMQYWLNQ